MKYSRRELAFLLPALVTASASAQGTAQTAAQPAADSSVEKLPVIKTKSYITHPSWGRTQPSWNQSYE
jgi:hypothetical protein